VLSLSKRLDELEPLARAQAGTLEKSVYGIVRSVNEDLSPNFVRKWKGTIGDMEPTDEEPTILIGEKLEPLILKHKKYKLVFGGRAGMKSMCAMDVMAGDVNSCGSKVFVLRERMKSLKQSIYSGIEGRIKALNLAGFRPVPSQWEIRHKTGGKFSFGGMQNIIDMKGSFDYKYFLMEESARTSQQTIDTLGPTLRGIDGAELWYIWNNESANDPMSLEFIIPFQAELDRCGYYEDEYHMIIKTGYRDNPWFDHDSSLSVEHKKDKEKMESGRMSKARYSHIWEGAFSDDINNSVIEADWFDACIDAHEKLGFKPRGSIVIGHDPSDVGRDAKGYSCRHGVVITRLLEIEAEDANRAFDIACREAKADNADAFGWDCDGMGALLRDQASKNFKGTKMHTFMYKGSEGVHKPEAIFDQSKDFNIKGDVKNKDVFKNRKAQNITGFAVRVKKTYEAVVHGVYSDPDDLISFSSERIGPKVMAKFRSECCKVPLKPGHTIQYYSKEEMRKGIQQPDGLKIVIPSPNLFDSAALSFDDDSVAIKRAYKPIKYETIL
jgi:phage terminase large subunit